MYRVATVRYNGIRIDNALIPENTYKKIYSEKKEKRKRSKTPKKELMTVLDTAWSEKVREIGFCEKCWDSRRIKKVDHLNAHHIFSRKHKATRWDLDNGICLCAGCHTLNNGSAHLDPKTFMDWLKEYKDLTTINSLQWRSNTTISYSVGELQMLLYKIKSSS